MVHRPPHVPVARGDAAAKIWLRPIRVEYAHGFNPAELRRLRAITAEHEALFIERWNEYFAR